MLQDAADIITNYGGEERPDYSGRSMYGNKTTGIVFDNDEQFYKAIADVMINEDEVERQIVASALRKLRTDNMGTGIIYY